MKKAMLILVPLLAISLVACAQPSPAPKPAPAATSAPAPAAAPSQAPAAAPKVIELKLTHHFGPTHICARATEDALQGIEAMSGGRLKVRIYGAESLAKSTESYDAVLGGVADIGEASPAFWPGRFPLIGLAELPGLFLNTVVATTCLNELLDTSPQIKDTFKDVVVLGLNTVSPNRLVLKKKIATLDEVKGMRLRSAGGLMSVMIEKIGATAVLLGTADIYTSFQRGLLDGLPFTVASIPPWKLQEVSNYTVDNLLFGVVSMSWVMNKDSFAKLPPDLQAIVLKLGRELTVRAGMNYDNDDVLAKAFLITKGMQFYDIAAPEGDKFNKLVNPLADDWVAQMTAKGLPGKEVLDSLRKIVEKNTVKWK